MNNGVEILLQRYAKNSILAVYYIKNEPASQDVFCVQNVNIVVLFVAFCLHISIIVVILHRVFHGIRTRLTWVVVRQPIFSPRRLTMADTVRSIKMPCSASDVAH